MKLRNSDKAELISCNEEAAVVQPIFEAIDAEFGDGTSLMLEENESFWDALHAVQVAQHWKSWRFGVRAGRMRATTPVTEAGDGSGTEACL